VKDPNDAKTTALKIAAVDRGAATPRKSDRRVDDDDDDDDDDGVDCNDDDDEDDEDDDDDDDDDEAAAVAEVAPVPPFPEACARTFIVSKGSVRAVPRKRRRCDAVHEERE